jgi:hypothetical protein
MAAGLVSQGSRPASTVGAYRRYGDWLDPANVRGLGEPLAEAEADGGGVARFDPIRLERGHPLWLVGTDPQGQPRAVRSSAPGDWQPRKEDRPDGTAQQSQSQAVSQHVRADELPGVRATAVHGPRTSVDARAPKEAARERVQRRALMREMLDGLDEEERREVVEELKREAAKAKGRRGPTARHHAPRPGEVGGPELEKGPGYEDDLGDAAA